VEVIGGFSYQFPSIGAPGIAILAMPSGKMTECVTMKR
jgi:hypothetical protein